MYEPDVAYDETNISWWRDAKWALYNYAYFEDPEKYLMTYNEVLNVIKDSEFTYSSGINMNSFIFNKFRALICFYFAKVSNIEEKQNDFDKLVNIFVEKYMHSLIEFIVLKSLFISNGVGYNCREVNDRNTSDIFIVSIDECSLEWVYEKLVKGYSFSNSWNWIYGVSKYANCMGEYFKKRYPEEYEFGTYCKEVLSGNKLYVEGIDGLIDKIPEKYREVYLKYKSDESINLVFIKFLDEWWKRIKWNCREYLRIKRIMPTPGSGLLGNFSSLNALVNRINLIHIDMGVTPLNVEQEFQELLTPTPDPKKFAKYCSETFIPVVDDPGTIIDLVKHRCRTSGIWHDYYNGFDDD